jgi:hypothetical protein
LNNRKAMSFIAMLLLDCGVPVVRNVVTSGAVARCWTIDIFHGR